MKIGFICNGCNKYLRVKDVGNHCPTCETETLTPDFQTYIFQDGDVEVSGDKKVHIGSRHARKEVKKRYEIAPVEECRDRVKDVQPTLRKDYTLSDDQKRLNSYMRRHGMSSSLFESHPTMKKVYHRNSRRK